MSVKIGDTDIKVARMPRDLNEKVINQFKSDKINVEIKDDKIYKILFGDMADKDKLRRYRFFIIPGLVERVKKLKKLIFPDMNTSFGEVSNILIKDGVKVILQGGAVRDLFWNKEPTDVDILFDKDVYEIKDICNREKWACDVIIPKYQYILFGEDKGISLEGKNLRKFLFMPILTHEFTVNDLAYDMKHNIFIDITGKGLSDILNKAIRISAPIPLYEEWAEKDPKKPLRYFKLVSKGYKPIHPKMQEFVIKYITDNFERVYEKPLYGNVSFIKHFLVVNMTQGEINAEDGSYKLGPNRDKLVPYLNTLKKYLPKDIMKKIYQSIDFVPQ